MTTGAWIVTGVLLACIVVLGEIVHRQHVRLSQRAQEVGELKTLLRRVMYTKVSHGGWVDTTLAKAAYAAIERRAS